MKKSPEQDRELGIDRFADMVSGSKLMRGLFLTATLASATAMNTACANANPPAAETAPLPSATNTTTKETTIAPSSTTAPTEMVTPTKTVVPSLTPTKEATLTPTEASLIKGDIFFDPQSKEDFSKVVESPSPIDNPTEFAKWQEEYLKQVNEKLKTYTGPTIDYKTAGIAFASGKIVLDGTDVKVISSYKFKWNGMEILAKTFVLKNDKGLLVPFSAIYPPENSSVGSHSYETLTGKVEMFLFYEANRQPKMASEPFFNGFFKSAGTETDFDSWRRYLAGVGTDEDRQRFSRIPFVLTTMYKIK